MDINGMDITIVMTTVGLLVNCTENQCVIAHMTTERWLITILLCKGIKWLVWHNQ